MTAAALPVWERGRFDAAKGTGSILFGRMYEDASIELSAFRPEGRILCIASAGCTAVPRASLRSIRLVLYFAAVSSWHKPSCKSCPIRSRSWSEISRICFSSRSRSVTSFAAIISR